MFDARYAAFAAISALLVISPGATMAVVLETALAEGRAAALRTIAGIGLANSSLGLASALGMSLLFHQWPIAIQAIQVGGAAYLGYLGLRGLWRAYRGRMAVVAAAQRETPPATAAGGQVARGLATNLLNPPVVLFYMTFLPQFVGPGDPVLARFALLVATHVGMSVAWLSLYAVALYAVALDLLAERLARPAVRRTLEGLTGLVLIGFAVKLFVSRF